MEYVKLNDGNKMPQLGLGLFQIPNKDEAKRVVSEGLSEGYRLIDTAAAYYNEEAVGKAIAESNVKREDIFVTSKLWINKYSYEKALLGIDESLKKLGVDYIDLYLLHQPYGDIAGAWRALIEAKKAGKIRSIGISNFMPDRLLDLELMSGVKPAVNQIEVSPWYQQNKAVLYNQSRNIQVEAWAPFAEGKHQIFKNEKIAAIAEKYGKSNSQVILRWLIQRELVVIPKTVHKERMRENAEVFDFKLDEADMKEMASLDMNESQFFDHRDPIAIENIFGASLRELKI